MFKKVLNDLKKLNIYIQDCKILESTRPAGHCSLCSTHAKIRHRVSAKDAFGSKMKLNLCENCFDLIESIVYFIRSEKY